MTSRTGRLLGIDVGDRRVGVAVSDAGQTVASPVAVVMRGSQELEELAELAHQYEATQLVVGLPTGMSGKEGPQAAGVRQFAETAGEALELPVSYWDERLTTVQAERSLIDSGRRR
ncbi:MAG: Holliday junction resolvase RuvX, partial [Thermomicrobiales bacterium]